jgi:hypothetical protein
MPLDTTLALKEQSELSPNVIMKKWPEIILSVRQVPTSISFKARVKLLKSFPGKIVRFFREKNSAMVGEAILNRREADRLDGTWQTNSC